MWHVFGAIVPHVVGAGAAHARHVDHFGLTHVAEDPASHAPLHRKFSQNATVPCAHVAHAFVRHRCDCPR